MQSLEFQLPIFCLLKMTPCSLKSIIIDLLINNWMAEQMKAQNNRELTQIVMLPKFYPIISALFRIKVLVMTRRKKDRELIKSLNRLDEAYHHGWELWGPDSQFLVLHTVTDILWNLFSWAFVMKSIAMCCRNPSVHALDSG